ncbi:MAG: hypothetical protein OXE49_19150 [Gemmatimonadetes bacterium]|nr:hypothetical protein [Gemmatimonadota bacterium]
MNQRQFDAFRAELRQMIETRIERPLDEINTRLAHVEEKLKEHDGRFDALDKKIGEVADRVDHHFANLAKKINIIDERLQKMEDKPPYATGRPESGAKER